MEPVVLQAVLSILVGLARGTGGTVQEDLHTGSTSLAGAGSTGPTRRSHTATSNPVEFHRYHQSHRGNDRGSSADEIANHGDYSFGPVAAPSSSILGSST